MTTIITMVKFNQQVFASIDVLNTSRLLKYNSIHHSTNNSLTLFPPCCLLCNLQSQRSDMFFSSWLVPFARHFVMKMIIRYSFAHYSAQPSKAPPRAFGQLNENSLIFSFAEKCFGQFSTYRFRYFLSHQSLALERPLPRETFGKQIEGNLLEPSHH